MNPHLLESVYRRLLREAPKKKTTRPKGQPFSPDDLAVVIEDRGTQFDATIYSPAALLQVFESDAYPSYGEGSMKNFRRLQTFGVFKGFISIEKPETPCNRAWEVKMSAGPGIGKVVYGVGYALSPSGILIPDRMSVSGPAQGGWSKQGDRKKKPLDNVDHPPTGSDPFHDEHHTEKTTDDCKTYPSREGLDFLNYSYEAEGWEKGALNTLKKNHTAAMGWIDTNYDGPIDSWEVEKTLVYYGPDFFGVTYDRFNPRSQ